MLVYKLKKRRIWKNFFMSFVCPEIKNRGIYNMNRIKMNGTLKSCNVEKLPLGPKLVLRIFETTLAARMCAL